MNVSPGCGDCAKQHNSKSNKYKSLYLCAKEMIITKSNEDIGNIFEYCHQWYCVVLQSSHAGKQHKTEQNIDRSPLSSSREAEGWILDPSHHLANLNGDDSDNGLVDDQQDIQSTSINKIVIAIYQHDRKWYSKVN